MQKKVSSLSLLRFGFSCICVVLAMGWWMGCTSAPNLDGGIRFCYNADDCLSGQECYLNICMTQLQRPDRRPVELPPGEQPPGEPSCVPQTEVCDGKDNDCDGKVDNFKGTDEPLREPCYTGPRGTQDVGICKAGLRRCEAGKWGACTGEVLPADEQQNCSDSLDNDCDGAVDEGCECTPGATSPCYGASEGCEKQADGSYKCQGTCKLGTLKCEKNQDDKWVWSSCQGEVRPSVETCNSQDDDCDGKVDNEKGTDNPMTQECYTGPQGTAGVGICKKGLAQCKAGKWDTTTCVGQVVPGTEVCDKIDNDCNGKVDDTKEGCACAAGEKQKCYSADPKTIGVAGCKQGEQVCTDGKWGTSCDGEVTPRAEECNGADDDCNGTVDDIAPRPCYTRSQGCTKQADGSYKCQGICATGTQQCVNGTWDVCKNEVPPAAKELCDQRDNNCDGNIDEGCKCHQGESRQCYSSSTGCTKNGDTYTCQAPCKAGTQSCDINGEWGACSGEVASKPETCNNVDDDCNGKIDDNLSRGCYDGSDGCTESGGNYTCKGACKAGTQTCSAGKWGACTGAVKPAMETCNGADDDCDGSIDESLTQQCYGASSGCTGGNGSYTCKGACKAGTQTCSAGKWGTCTGEVGPASGDPCGDKIDNDCNGTVDDGCCTDNTTQACYTGSTGCTKNGASYTCTGACKAGTQTCSGGKWGTCTGEIKAGTETCNGKDDDCDGSIDESLTRQCWDSLPANYGCIKQSDGTYACKGICKAGTETCSAGSWGACTGQVDYKSELCSNGQDEDCDGQVDESSCSCVNGTQEDCYTGTSGCTKNGASYTCVGACKAGKRTCTGGSWSACNGEVKPTGETCNGADDDCDGSIDENLTRQCWNSVPANYGCINQGNGTYVCKGICKAGVETCSGGSWGACTGQVGYKSEQCGNGQDDDCDGAVDEGC